MDIVYMVFEESNARVQAAKTINTPGSSAHLKYSANITYFGNYLSNAAVTHGSYTYPLNGCNTVFSLNGPIRWLGLARSLVRGGPTNPAKNLSPGRAEQRDQAAKILPDWPLKFEAIHILSTHDNN